MELLVSAIGESPTLRDPTMGAGGAARAARARSQAGIYSCPGDARGKICHYHDGQVRAQCRGWTDGRVHADVHGPCRGGIAGRAAEKPKDGARSAGADEI